MIAERAVTRESTYPKSEPFPKRVPCHGSEPDVWRDRKPGSEPCSEIVPFYIERAASGESTEHVERAEFAESIET